MTQRNLDGYYFRVERDGKIENVCFSDLTHLERHMVLKSFDREALENMCIGLADTIEQIGKQFDLECVCVE